MTNKNWFKKIKELIKQRDSRFWLMIFVVISTLTIFILWSINLNNIFSIKENYSEKNDDINISEIKNGLGETLNSFVSLLDKSKDENGQNNEYLSSSTESLSRDELEKIKDILNKKISSSSPEIVDKKNNSSSNPIISEDLDNSEQEIAELKRRILELEESLKN